MTRVDELEIELTHKTEHMKRMEQKIRELEDRVGQQAVTISGLRRSKAAAGFDPTFAESDPRERAKNLSWL